jgi:predicted HNH restriction endonuclease
MDLVRSKLYTRDEIHRHVGGGNRIAYLLLVGGRIVAACLDPKMNPDAPRVILVGRRPQVESYGRQLASQSEAIEVFLKRVSGDRDADGAPLNWEYWGKFATDRVISEQREIQEYEARSKRSGLSSVIILRPVVSDSDKKSEEFREGACQQVTRDQLERNKKARKKCIDLHGYRCAACGMLFSERYGEIGKDFIHVHHCAGMANEKGERTVDPQKDLVPVCPNCHAMLHRQSPVPYTIDELRLVLRAPR